MSSRCLVLYLKCIFQSQQLSSAKVRHTRDAWRCERLALQCKLFAKSPCSITLHGRAERQIQTGGIRLSAGRYASLRTMNRIQKRPLLPDSIVATTNEQLIWSHHPLCEDFLLNFGQLQLQPVRALRSLEVHREEAYEPTNLAETRTR